MGIFESLENLQVSEGCFADIINKVWVLLEENPPIVRHEFSNGQIVDQGQLFPTEHTGQTVKAKDVGAEYVKPKRVRRAPTKKKSAPVKEAPGQLNLFNQPEENKDN